MTSAMTPMLEQRFLIVVLATTFHTFRETTAPNTTKKPPFLPTSYYLFL
jgi:hypothetical protein